MKELTIEQKAQRYDEAIKIAKDSFNYPSYPGFIRADVVFPELKESKNWIPKEIIKYLKEKGDFRSCWIAWLEKQGEQKVADKVETKFKVGDWVVQNERKNIVKVVNTTPFVYKVVDILGYHYTITDTAIKNNYHLWTIEDAKDGDVLSFNDGHGNDCIELIKSITDKNIEFWFCLTNGNRYEVFDGITPYTNLVSREDATPATKEQRDTLMKAIAEAGYTFDFERKELNKVEQNNACNEEDKRIVKEIIDILDSYDVAHLKAAGLPSKISEYIAWLKKQCSQKPTWSEEDEKIYQSIMDDTVQENQLDSKQIDWLKSLKGRYIWKPSEAQISALDFAIDCTVCPEFQDKRKALIELLEQLKKLRGE